MLDHMVEVDFLVLEVIGNVSDLVLLNTVQSFLFRLMVQILISLAQD